MSLTDLGWVVGAYNSPTHFPYQLGEYAKGPLYDDPYYPGQRGPKDAAAMLVKLDVMLSSLEKGSFSSKL
jgi:hypothetical protein